MLLLLTLHPAFAGDVEIHDSLANSSSASVVYGGTFTGAGWRVDDPNSRMYWDFGQQVDTGDISVTIDDISWDNLTGENNHLIELFDAGGHFSGATRAINLRVYGAGDGTAADWGEVKLKVWDPSNAAEARASAQDWDGGPHVWRITWNPSECVLYRDGAELIRLDVSAIDTRVGTLWLPLDDWAGDYSAPIGTLYSHLDLSASAPSTEDTGALPDDGDPATFTPIDDVTAASWESAVYPDVHDLSVEGDGTAATAVTWMKFDLSAITAPITSATLTLHAQSIDSADGDGGELHLGPNTAWSEQTVTWATRPELGALLGTYPHVSPGDVETFDVSGAITAGGVYAFALASTGANGTHFSSKEDAGGSAAPVLRITTGSATSDTGQGEDSAGTGDSHAQGDSSRDTAGGPQDPVSNLGCGCASGGGGLSLAVAFAALGLVAGRRRGVPRSS